MNDLFGNQSPRIVPPAQAPLSRDQKMFNNLIRKIEGKRAELAAWESAINQFRRQYGSDLSPLRDQERALYGELAQALDLLHGQKGITKAENRKLGAMIVDLAAAYLAHEDNAGIKALYNKYSASDLDAEAAEEQAYLKEMLEEMLGVDLGDDVDLNSFSDVMSRVHEQRAGQDDFDEEDAGKPNKTAKERARETRLENEKKELSQSIREVYRKLASSLHPDREVDPLERQRKTELMQRVNAAYEQANLLQLLELQLAVEQIDEAHLAGLPPQRLKNYIKLLKEQLSELDEEVGHVTHGFIADFGLSPFDLYRPADLALIIQQDIRGSRQNIEDLQAQLALLGDLKAVKSWLKSIKLAHRRPRYDEDFPFF